jgi:hypothetical protein
MQLARWEDLRVSCSGSEDGRTRVQLVDGWLRFNEHKDTRPPGHEWALFAVQDLALDDDPTKCVSVIVDLVHAAWNPWQLTMIGADPLEHLVNRGDGYALDAVDQAVGNDASFVPVLEAVWPGTKAATQRVDTMLARLRHVQGHEPTRHERKRGPGRYRQAP